MRVSGIILAGGKSRRMGTDKRELPISDGLTLLDSVEQKLLSCCDEVIVVNNKNSIKRSKSIIEVSDIYLNAGPLAGIHAGLSAAKYETAFVAACDMPFIDVQLIKYLLVQSAGYDITVLKQGEKVETLFAVYCKSALKEIEKALELEHYKVSAIFRKLQVNYIDVLDIKESYDYERILLNINRPEDYQTAILQWKEQK